MYNYTLSDYESALDFINPNILTYDEWIRIGMSARSAGIQFDKFNDWSRQDGRYKTDKYCRDKWKSFKPTGGTSPGTLIDYAQRNGFKRDNSAIQDIKPLLPKLKPIADNEPPPIEDEYFNTLDEDYIPSTPDTIFTKRKSPQELWNICKEAENEHPYIVKKGGWGDGLKVYPHDADDYFIDNISIRGYLAVPCYEDGLLRTIQFIPPEEGKKLFVGGAKSELGYFTIGSLDENPKKIYIAEGIGHCWTINSLTGDFVVNTFGSGRLKKIAELHREKYPDCEFIIVSDKGNEDKCVSIAKIVNGSVLKLPDCMKQNDDINDYYLEYGEDKTLAILNKSNELKYKFLKFNDADVAPNMEWLLKGIFPMRSVCSIFGESGTGKSFMGLDLSLNICAGESHWFGRRIKNVPVTYLCLEGEEGFVNRLKAWKKKYPIKSKKIENSFNYLTNSFNCANEEDTNNLIKSIKHFNAENGLIIIDTLSCSMAGLDENTSEGMGTVLLRAKKIKEETGCCVLFIHHTPKGDKEDTRGHSSFFSNIDGALYLKELADNFVMKVKKAKDGRIDEEFQFDLDIIPLGLDSDNDEVTSCVIIELYKSKSNENKIFDLTDKQELVYDWVVKKSQISDKRGPDNEKLIDKDEFILFIGSLLTDDQRSQKSRGREQLESLKKRGLIGFDKTNSWLFLIQ